MLDWLKKHWFRLPTTLLFLASVAGLVWAITLKSGVFIATMVAFCGILGMFVYSDYKSLKAKK